MNHKDLRFIKTEQQIKQAFFDLVNKTDFENITVSNICKKAMISRFTFYSHYNDKEQLLQSLFDELENNLINSVNPSILDQASKGDFKESARRCVHDALQHKKEIKALIKCNRELFKSVIEKTYFDIPTSMYVKNYTKRKQEERIQLWKSYLINGLIGFLETAISDKSGMREEELVEQLYLLINEASTQFTLLV